MSMVSVTIDGKAVQVEAGTTILEAARLAGVKIPTLCHLEGISATGSCRICVVNVKGARTLQAACVTPVADGMVVVTASPEVRAARRLTLELILSDHHQDCLKCVRNQNCELQALAAELGVRTSRFEGQRRAQPRDLSSPSLVRDPEKCILCRRCVAVCGQVQGVGAIAPKHRGLMTAIGPAFEDSLLDAACTMCGQCALVCPVGALYEHEQVDEAWAALGDPEKHVVVQTAPAVRVSIGEAFGLPPGAVSTGRLVAALRALGFDKVFDTDFTADLTIMEEGHELLDRLQNAGPLPLFTSCSPGWVRYAEYFYPELLPNISTCKSPQQMFGTLAKTYYADKAGLDPAQVVVVSVMPCTAKKLEAVRPEMATSGYRDVDIVLTTRELARMIKEAGIDFGRLEDSEYDAPLGLSTGAAVLFGATGGVMEAALRTAYEVVTGRELPGIDFTSVRGLDGIKEAVVDLDGVELRVAVGHGLANARQIVECVQTDRNRWHFVEIMCCPGGCIGGGGQPIPTNTAVRSQRMAGIYEADRGMQLRKSHQNPAVLELYRDFLGRPLGERSHRLLHTHYVARGRNRPQSSVAAGS